VNAAMTGNSIDSAAAANLRLEAEMLSRQGGQAAELLEQLEPEERLAVFRRQPTVAMLPIWERLGAESGGELLAALDEGPAAEALGALDPVLAARFLSNLPEPGRNRLLALAEPRAGREIRAALDYPPDTAGALMEARPRLFFRDSQVGEVRAALRRDQRQGRAGFFVVDGDNQPAGWVDMQSVAVAGAETSLAELARGVSAVATVLTPWEEVVEIMDRHHLLELAVLDANGKVAGVIRHAALAEAEREAAVIDLQTMVGVGKEERATSPALFAVRKRLPWLQINLLTAFLAAAVVSLFENIIAAFTVLAVLLPVVAGQSGNAGAQALAVAIRGLALREIRVSQWRRTLLKEAGVGLWNGALVALTCSAGVWLWSGSSGLALIIAISMVLAMFIAGVAGAGIPIVLAALGQDPAQSSSILLTTVTDIVAFFSFLGIATLLAGWI